MNIETLTEKDGDIKTTTPGPFPKTLRGRLLVASFILVMPALLFSAVELFKPEWQTGKLSDYVILSLSPQASWVFFPFLAYSIVCYLLLLSDPHRYSASFAVRLGIYSGLLLALQYVVVVLIASVDTFNFFIPGIWAISISVFYLYQWAAKRWGSYIVIRLLLLIIMVILLVSALKTSTIWTILGLPLMVLAAITPVWCFLLALWTATWLLQDWETKLTLVRGIGMAAWLAGYAAAWRFNILKMFELYNSLPASPPPDCYIATAAARGHPRWVGSWVVRIGGRTMRVNRQLQVLKCAELALMAMHPHAHRHIRGIYDRVGKSLAHRIQNPFIADLAYLLLKPAEWLARLLLSILVPEMHSISRKIYLE